MKATTIIRQTYGNNPPPYTASVVKSAAAFIKKQSLSQMHKDNQQKKISSKAKFYRKLLLYAVRSCWGKGVKMV